MLSIFAYSFALGPWFSIGFVALIFVHEIGHVVALKRKGLPASVPVFIPFLGAAIFSPNLGNRDDEAYVGIAGPVIGGVVALSLVGATAALNHPPELLVMLAYIGVFINVLNMIPIRPLDGGRVTQAVGPWFKYIGLFVLVGGTVLLRATGFLLIWILVLSELRLPRRFKLIVAWTILVTMVIMLFGGIGLHQPWWLNVIDTVIGLSFCAMISAVPDELLDDRNNMPQLNSSRKRYWLMIYVTVTVVLIAGMVISYGHLPPSAKH